MQVKTLQNVEGNLLLTYIHLFLIMNIQLNKYQCDKCDEWK